MKKAYFLLLSCIFIILSCENLNKNNEKESPTSSVSNNLSSSVGENELDGGVFSNDDIALSFSEKSVTYSLNPESEVSEISRASSSDFNPLMEFAYSYNSEDKKLEFQVKKLFENGIASDYDAQVSEAKNQCLLIDDLIIQSLADDSIYAFFGEYKDSAKKIVLDKVKNYVSNQEALLEDYLVAKYNSVLTFDYDFDSSTNILNINEVFKNDLTDASSKFVYLSDDSSLKVVLNDYENLIPFSVSITSEDETIIYVGIPKFEFELEDDSWGTLKVDLFKYEGQTSAQESLNVYTEEVESIVSQITESATTIFTEMTLSYGQSSETLSSIIDDSNLGLISMEFDFHITNDSRLVLLPESVPEIFSTISAFNSGFVMHYTPILAMNLELNKIN